MSPKKPSGLIIVGNTTVENLNIPLYVGHSDSSALHVDFRADVSSLDIDLLGKSLTPALIGAKRESILQSNTGGQLTANVKLIVENIHPYVMKMDDHYPPEGLKEFLIKFEKQRNYIQSLIDFHSKTYMTITSKESLEKVMTTEGKIGIINSVEGMPLQIDSIDEAAKLFVKTNTLILNLMCNQNTDVGDSHRTNDDHGLSKKGKHLIRICSENGIPVFDVSHASPKTAMDMIEFVPSNRRVIASHTGARIGKVRDYSRNITDDVARAIFQRSGIIGVAITSRLLGGETIEYAIRAVDHFINLDPTGGRLITLGLDFNGITKGTEIRDAQTVLDTPNIASALRKSGYSTTMIEDIFWRNAYYFWLDALEAREKIS